MWMVVPWLTWLMGMTEMNLLQLLQVAVSLALIQGGAKENLELVVRVCSCAFLAHLQFQNLHFWGPANVDQSQTFLGAEPR